MFQTLNNELFVTTNTTLNNSPNLKKQGNEIILYPSLFLFSFQIHNNLCSRQCNRYKSVCSDLSAFISRCSCAGSLGFLSSILFSQFMLYSVTPFSQRSIILSYETFIRSLSVRTDSLLKLSCFLFFIVVLFVLVFSCFVLRLVISFYGIIIVSVSEINVYRVIGQVTCVFIENDIGC